MEGALVTPVLLVILTLTAAGAPMARAADPSSRGGRLLGEAFLYGSGVAALGLYFISLSGLSWSALLAVMPLLAVSALALLVRRAPVAPTGMAGFQPAGQAGNLSSPDAKDGPVQGSRAIAHALDLITAVFLGGYVKYATAASPWQWDFWAIWGLKAKVFFFTGGVDWPFLQEQWNNFVHPDYPLLVPLLFDFAALAQGEWDDRWLGWLFVAFAGAALLIVRAHVTEATGSRVIGAAATLAATGAALTTWVGMAEGPLIAYAAAALLLLRRGILRDDAASFRSGAILLGLAALTKNEGVSLLVAVGAAALIVFWPQWRRAIRLWPALLLAASWQIPKTLRHLETDLFEGSVADRMVAGVMGMGRVAEALAQNPPDQPLYWVALIVALALGWKRLFTRERFLTLALAIQILFYVAAYVATPNDLFWHVANSWVRILGQITLLLTVLATLVLAPALLRRGEGAASEEARGEGVGGEPDEQSPVIRA